MNIFELLQLFFAIGVGIRLGEYFSQSIGWLGWPVGLIISFSVIFGIGLILDYVTNAVKPFLPCCKKGKCKFKNSDYKYICTEADGSLVFQCKCGDKYLKRKNILFVLDKNNNEIPYMKRTFFKWKGLS
ncbi:MAG: hypothetical protein JXM68_02200 [Sedimentisphaerales bacterium]|nr:hypothetical protein [Sedimentisphaerales bacterium]